MGIFGTPTSSGAPARSRSTGSIFGKDWQSNLSTYQQQVSSNDQAAAKSASQSRTLQPAPKPKTSLFQKVTKGAKEFASGATTGEQKVAQGFARVLPGGNNDLKAEQASSQADQANLKRATNLFQSGKISKSQYQKLTATTAQQANQTSKQVTATEKSMPTKTQIGLGSASTAADIVTGGSLPEIKAAFLGAKGTKALNIGAQLAGNAAAGGLNAAAGGGSKGEVAKNAAFGAVLPEVLHHGSDLVSHGASKVVDKVGPGRNTPEAKELVRNARTNELLSKAKDEPTPEPQTTYNPSNPKVKEIVDARRKQAEALQAPQKQAEAAQATAEKEAQVTADKTQKIDRQIEVIKAKGKDSETGLSNVDKTKLGHLQEDKAQLQAPDTASTPTTPVTPATVPAIKVFGKSIALTKENGYRAVPTAVKDADGNPVHIYQKGQKTTGNSRGINSITSHWYNSKGTKLTEAQARAAIEGDTALAGVTTHAVDAPTTPTTPPAGEAPLTPAKPAEPSSTKPDEQSSVKNTPATESEQKANTHTAKEAATVAPPRTLTPSETAHMEPVGGYTHSKDMVKDYADMLREQEKQAKGGQLINTEGETYSGDYKRITEHSKFYREFYAENKKPPTIADYRAEATRHLESGRDAFGAGEDYKKLLERESKPLPRADFKPQVTGESRTSGSAMSAEARAVQQKLVKEFKDKASYNGGSFKDEAIKADNLVKNDPQKAMDIAMGKTPGDNTIHEVAVARALENKALQEGDVSTLLALSNSSRHTVTSEAAQRLGAEGYGEKNSVVEQLAQIKKVRQDAFERRSGQSFDKVVSEGLRAAKKEIAPVKVKDWNSLIESLKC